MSQEITVVHVETGKHLYGGALQVIYLMGGLQELAVRNILVTPVGSDIASAAKDVADRVYEVPMAGDLDVAFIFRLKKILQQEHADLVHLHSRRGADILGALAARFAGVKAVLSRRVDNPESAWLVKCKYRLYARVITISDGIRRVLVHEGVPEDKIVCIHSAVDVEKFSRKARPTWFLKEFSLPENAKVLGVVAQLIHRKGHRYFLDVLPELIQRHPDLYVLMFGQGPLCETLSAQVAQAEYQGRVRLVGFRDDLPDILPCLYGIVHPADMEGLGVSLLQAAASRVPIVASEVGGIPEIVCDEVNGYLVPVGDTSVLLDRVHALLDDPIRARELGEAGRLRVQEKFSIAAMVNGNYRVYQSLLQKQ